MNNATPINETSAERLARYDVEYAAEKAAHRLHNITNTTHYHEKLTVAELIRFLQTLDQNAIVEVKDADGRFGTVSNSDIDDGVRAQTGEPTVFIGY